MNTKLIIGLILLLFGGLIQAQQKRIQSVQDQSWIEYKVTHPLHEVEAKSKDAVCYLMIVPDSQKIKQVAVQVSVSTFNSGNSNRDSHMMETVDALDYSYVRFISSSVVQTGDSVKATGKLTFHGVTKSITIAAKDVWTKNNLTLDPPCLY